MYRRILVATWGSAWSDAAVAYATDLAARTGAALRIVTVLNAPTASARPDPTWRPDRLIADIEHMGQVIATQAAAQADSAFWRVVYAKPLDAVQAGKVGKAAVLSMQGGQPCHCA